MTELFLYFIIILFLWLVYMKYVLKSKVELTENDDLVLWYGKKKRKYVILYKNDDLW